MIDSCHQITTDGRSRLKWVLLLGFKVRLRLNVSSEVLCVLCSLRTGVSLSLLAELVQDQFTCWRIT